MNRSIAATIIGIVVAVGLALLTQPEWLLDFLPTRRIGPNLIFTFVMVSSHYLERSELEPTLRPPVCSVDKAFVQHFTARLALLRISAAQFVSLLGTVRWRQLKVPFWTMLKAETAC